MREKQKAGIPSTGSTPLDEIRQAEAEAAGLLFQARQEGQALKQAVKKQISQLMQQAQQEGAQAGRIRCEQLVEEARRQAAQMIAQAQTQADLLLGEGQKRLDTAVQWALCFVLGADSGDGQP